MAIVFTAEQIQKIYAHAESVYPEECCGILLGKPDKLDRAVIEVMLTNNSWERSEITNSINIDSEIDSLTDRLRQRSKHSRYSIDPKDILLAQKRARDLNIDTIGFFHSHPDNPAIPSTYDRDLAWEVYSYPIVSVIEGKVSDIQSWVLDDNGIFQAEQIQVILH